MAAYECGSTDFQEPPYPERLLCPESVPEVDGVKKVKAVMTVWQILSKVRIEAFCWGVGTALGELPPYFMARAHRFAKRNLTYKPEIVSLFHVYSRLSGYDPDEEEDEFDIEMEDLTSSS